MEEQQILNIFRNSQMYREIEKYFAKESIPNFEEEFLEMIKEYEKLSKES